MHSSRRRFAVGFILMLSFNVYLRGKARPGVNAEFGRSAHELQGKLPLRQGHV